MRLADCFVGVLAYTELTLRQPAAGYDEFRRRVEAMLGEAAERARRAGVTDADYKAALFAVAAWIDETVMCSGWSDAARWEKELLQRIHFNTARAGVELFSRLEQLAPQQKAVREVYYLCLELGFKGKYVYDSDPNVLRSLKQKHLELLVPDAGIQLEADARLFPDAYPAPRPESAEARRRFSVSTATIAIAVIPAAVVAVLYAAYHVALHGLVTAFLPLMK